MTDCYPILGGTSLEQLKSNIEAVSRAPLPSWPSSFLSPLPKRIIWIQYSKSHFADPAFRHSITARSGIMNLFPLGPEPQTELVRYSILAPKGCARSHPSASGPCRSATSGRGGGAGGKLHAAESEKFVDAF